jgi:predicted phosphodiesterase
MEILVIPDIHENLDFLKYIFALDDRARNDHMVLLGDYFDPSARPRVA